MILQITASSDSYITNKIIDSRTRATDSNVGHASTIDLFKLYNETSVLGESNPIELSRGVIKFPLSELSASLTDQVSFDNSSFKVYLELFDVQGTQLAPSGFDLVVYPLAKSFDEGIGSDVASFNDLDRVNWLTASYSSSTNNLWTLSGAKSSGSLGSTTNAGTGDLTLDVISSGSLYADTAILNFSAEQYFETGRENLVLDITTIVSASMCGYFQDYGFLIAFSGSQEWDDKSRFVKRFASRHTKNPYKRPRIRAEWDSSIIDYHNMLEFNTTGSLYLGTYAYNQSANLFSGSANADVQLTGANCLKVSLATGSFTASADASQASINGFYRTGLYSVDFAINQFDQTVTSYSTTLESHIAASGSIVFTERWKDATNETITYFERDTRVYSPRILSNQSKRDLRFSVLDLKSKYKKGSNSRVRLFIRDRNQADEPTRTPVQLASITLKEVYYQIKDADNGQILVDFIVQFPTNATRVNTDSEGMYFDIPIDILPINKTYTINLLVSDRNTESIYETNTRFMVV